MPSRKQRRRREKLKRHEYEYVYVDEEGEEVEVDPAELREAREQKKAEPARAAKAGAARRGRRASGRVVQPPSWSKVGKRGLLFAPLMFLAISFLDSKLTVAQRIVQTAILMAFFLPFSYVMDSFMYRAYLRRTGQAPPREPRAPRRRGRKTES